MQQEIYSIATIGDSLTEGGGRGTIIGPRVSIPNMYQFWAREWLMNKGVFCEVRNYGSSGQVIGEICGRFNETVPADVIVVMGGTNDVWRCREGAPGIEDEIAQAIVAGYRKVVPEAIDAQVAGGGAAPIVVIASIPPLGDLDAMPRNLHLAIVHINEQLEAFVARCNIPNVTFCDVHKGMRGDDLYMRPGLYLPDGVHFAIDGNRACGECIAAKIYEVLR